MLTFRDKIEKIGHLPIALAENKEKKKASSMKMEHHICISIGDTRHELKRTKHTLTASLFTDRNTESLIKKKA